MILIQNAFFCAAAIAALLCLGPAAQASPIHETYIFPGAPTSEMISVWSSLPGTRSYLLQMDGPSQGELEPILRLGGADRVQIEVTRFPGEDAVDTWKKLAGRGVELVGLDAGIPNDDEIDRLNRIGLPGYVFVVRGFPGVEEANRLARLQAPASLTFVTSMYPKFEDRPGLLALPKTIPLLFVTDYWPWYAHMDVLNMIPNPQRLRVSDMFPPDEELPYLQNLHQLRDVMVETDYDAPNGAADWNKFGKLAVRWSSKNRVPSADGLAAFERSAGAGGSRKLTVDQDLPLTDEERGRLEKSPLAVEWLHLAPSSFLKRPPLNRQ